MALADFLVSLLTVVSIYTLFGLGLNIKFGFTGLVDFGHVLYFLVGAYVTVVLTIPPGTSGYQGIGGFGAPEVLSALPLGGLLGWLLALGIAMVAAALVSLAVGVPTLRLREDYLAITALGVATIFHAVVNDERWLFNGPFGVRDVYAPLEGVFPVSLGSFLVNLAVFGLLSVVVLGYLGYRVGGYLRPRRPTRGGLRARLRRAGRRGPRHRHARRRPRARPGRSSPPPASGCSRRASAPATASAGRWRCSRPRCSPCGTSARRCSRSDRRASSRSLVWLFDPTVGTAGGFTYGRFVLLVSVGFLGLAYWWCERTVNSPYGRVLRSIREDESVPEALGKRTFRYKVQSMMFGSALAGAAGGLWATQIGFIDPSQFTAEITFFAFSAVIIGGTANNRGVIVGTIVFWTLYTGTRFLNDFFPAEYATQLAALRLMFIGALLIVILYYRSEGLLGRQTYDTGVTPGVVAVTDPILAVEDVERYFGGITALDGASFDVEPGITGLIGPNGAGKSTMFDCITGFLEPDGGTVRFRGEDITGERPPAVAERGLVRTFQIPRELPEMTVRENLALAPKNQSGERLVTTWTRAATTTPTRPRHSGARSRWPSASR